MTWQPHDYDKIPGTYVFDGQRSNSAYGLNKLLFSFNHEENRNHFARDPEGYANLFPLTPEQHKALVEKDFLEMIRLGANIYYMAKLAVPSGVSVQHAGAAFQGISVEDFRANLEAKAEGLEEKLAREGGFWNG